MNARFVYSLLRSTSAAALLCAAATGAMAQAPSNINGGGSTLAGPTYLGRDLLGAGSGNTYAEVGSGAGQWGFLSNDCTFGGKQSPALCVDNPKTVHFGGSDSPFSAASPTASDPANAANIYTVNADGTFSQTGGSGFSGGSSRDGHLIQIPSFGTPVTIPISTLGSNGGLTLTDDDLCGVFSGAITDFSHLSNPGGRSGRITVSYRSDSSGTSFLLTNHLAQPGVCTSSNSHFTGPVVATKSFNTLPLAAGVLATFVPGDGSGGVQANLLPGAATPANFAYLSPDYTSIAPKPNLPAGKHLFVARLVNRNNNTSYLPTLQNTRSAIIHPGANNGATNPTPPKTLAAAANPFNWIQTLPNPTIGYPIAGVTTLDFATCYTSATDAKSTTTFIKQLYGPGPAGATTPGNLDIVNGGFVPLLGQAVGMTPANTFALRVKSDFLGGLGQLSINGPSCSGKAGR